MKIIIFGGSGFLGSHVADALHEAGHDVTIFDMRESPFLSEGQKMVVGDILDTEHVNRAVKRMDVVYNFAGIADINEAASMPIETVQYNIMGNTIILEAARLAEVKRFIFASTVYVYSNMGSFYRCSKNACELYIENYQQQYGLDYTILRYGTLYGTRADERNSVFRFLKEAMTSGSISYSGDGSEVREYINVLDAAKGSVEVLSEEFRNQHVILTGHQPMKVGDLFAMIREMLGKEVEVKYTKPDEKGAHYSITPHSFIPKVGKKLVSHYYTDMGQGLLICMQEQHDRQISDKGQ